MELQNKTILITGSTDGLGKALAKTLIELGAKVIVHGRNEERVQATVKELGAEKGIVCDFTRPETMRENFAEISHLDILINNAGVWLEGNTIDAPLEKILELVNVNLASHIFTTRVLLHLLEKAEFGQVLNVVSTSGIDIPTDHFSTTYSATKYGMQGFSEAITKEYANKNIRCMGFYPGGMNTKIFVKSGDNETKEHEPWMFDTKESVEAIIFMLTRNPKVNIKRLDLINHLLI